MLLITKEKIFLLKDATDEKSEVNLENLKDVFFKPLTLQNYKEFHFKVLTFKFRKRLRQVHIR